MAEQVIKYLQGLGFGDLVITLIISMLPIFELRGSIPVGILVLKNPYVPIIAISLIGNLLPIPFLLKFFDLITKLLRKFKLTSKILDWVFKRTRKKTGLIEKFEFWGLVLLVSIPLPFTGAWTGVVASYLTGLKFKKAMTGIIVGVLIAGIVVSLLTIFIDQGILHRSGIFLKYK